MSVPVQPHSVFNCTKVYASIRSKIFYKDKNEECVITVNERYISFIISALNSSVRVYSVSTDSR